MGKTNKKGRNKYEAHIRLHRGLTRSAAWQDLSCEARCLLLEIWQRNNGRNNGEISFSNREAREALGIGPNKAVRLFKDLEEHGFIINRFKGHFDRKKKWASEWEITEEECDGKPAKKLYKKWSENLNTVTDLVTDSYCTGNRDPNNGDQKPPDGYCSGNQKGQFEPSHGYCADSTYNIPGGSPELAAGKTRLVVVK